MPNRRETTAPAPLTLEPLSLDLRTIEPRLRHPVVFETLAQLPGGGALVIVNDHDPKPLVRHLDSHEPGAFEALYLEGGPVTWRVRIARLKDAGRSCICASRG